MILRIAHPLAHSLAHSRESGADDAHPRSRHLRSAVALSFIALPLGMVMTPAAAASAPKPKQPFALRIGIDDGRTTVRPGDRLTYTTKISNTGRERTPGLVLTQTLVPGLKLVSSTPEGTVSAGQIIWKSTLPAGKTDQFSATVQVGRLPGQLQRLAAVACASNKIGKRPIVCAAHSDRLQAPAPTGLAHRVTALALSRALWWTAAGVGALLMTALTLFVRRRRASPTP
jgi:uncharacterized repeat protein (TIGR01451 family)